MKLLADWTISRDGAERKIELLCGDLTKLPAEHAVNVLIVSAFQNDYTPTAGSLIGALTKAEVSVADLAKNKQADLRREYSCWLSKPVNSSLNFGQILCIESGWRGSANEITEDVFRALAPYLLSDLKDCTIAMPLIGTGDQGHDPAEMLREILSAAVNWIERGLPLKLLKIVVQDEDNVRGLLDTFFSCKREWETDKKAANCNSNLYTYDIFLSYAHSDFEVADYFMEKMDSFSKQLKIFHDRISLHAGATWLMEIAEALDSSRYVVPLYTPSYWLSKNCQMEFLAAFTRQNDTKTKVLFPIYLSEVQIPYMFKNMQYIDCRDKDLAKVESACVQLETALKR